MPEQNTRFVVEGLKPLAKDFQAIVRNQLAATKTVEDIERELKRAEAELDAEVDKLERELKVFRSSVT